MNVTCEECKNAWNLSMIKKALPAKGFRRLFKKFDDFENYF